MAWLEKFVKIPKNKRIWAISSVHSESERLRILHQSIAKEYSPGDIVIYLGNLIGVNDEVIETINEFLLFRRALIASPDANIEDVICLRGMQEEMWSKFLQLHYAQKPKEILNWMLLRGFGTTIKAYGGNPDDGLEICDRGAVAISRWINNIRDNFLSYDGHRQYFANLFHAGYVENKALFVSAGFDNNISLENQSDSLWWESKTPFENTQNQNQQYELIVRGYTQKPDKEKAYLSKNKITLDLGAGFGGKLSACLFDESLKPIELISV